MTAPNAVMALKEEDRPRLEVEIQRGDGSDRRLRADV